MIIPAPRLKFTLGPVFSHPQIMAGWLQLTIITCLEAHARPDIVWLALASEEDRAELPDLMFVIPGSQVCFMSFLAADAAPDPELLALKARLEAAGAGFALISDEKAALRALRDWNVLKGEGPSSCSAHTAPPDLSLPPRQYCPVVEDNRSFRVADMAAKYDLAQISPVVSPDVSPVTYGNL